MSTTLGDLTPRDIGRRIRVDGGRASVEGQLLGFDIDTDWITEVALTQRPEDTEQVPGRRTVTVNVGTWTTDRLPLDTKVTFL